MSGRIVLLEGDITEQEVDAVVNAANSDLVLGAGVAGAIRTRGGPTIQAECDAHGPVEVGGAAITGAGDLPARFVIHAASMPPGGSASEESVRASMRGSLRLAEENACATIAVPAIGAGIAGFPMQRCAEVLLEEARAHLAGEPAGEPAESAELAAESTIQEIRFVLFGEPDYRVFEMVNDAARVAEQMERMAKHRATGGDPC